MEKEHQPDSMATITMKPEYPPSEVYSTSEPPPAYHKRGSNSVQIARIIALTVVASSFILGSFILASSWVAARASCHQLEQLDAMLDKELALEGRAYGNDGLLPDEPLPIANAHALHAAPPKPSQATEAASAPAQAIQPPAADSHTKEDALTQAESKIDEDKLQKLDVTKTKIEVPNSDSDENSDSDSSAEEDDDLDGLRPMFKLPIQFDLDELAGAFLANNQKGRMNCVVERRHEEPMERRFPFNILGAFAPRSAHADRVAIICHGGDEPRGMNGFPEPQSQVFAFPLSGPVRLPIRPQPEQRPTGPAPGPEPRMPFNVMSQHRPAPFPLPMPWDSSEEQQMGGAPREMRIHVQRVIAIPGPHNMAPPSENMSPFAPPPPPPQMQQPQEQLQQPAVMHQFVPQQAPVQELEQPEMQKMSTPQMNLPWGLTPEDMQIIHRAAEDAAATQGRDQVDNDMQEVKTILVNKLAEAEADEENEENKTLEQFGGFRTLMLPKDVPAQERPHYVQPRSVRSVDAVLHREKRMKRCSCACK